MPISAISDESRSSTAWLGLVLPALLINYFGQGALVLAHPSAIENPFYRLMPEALLLPMVVLATAATVIASQAVITGAYSLVRQAIQLGLLPRLAIVHTSAEYSGQIYLPRVNTLLLIGVLLLVGLFRTSSSLASAYGIAVATTMVVDGVLGVHRDLAAVGLAGLEGCAVDGAAGRGRLRVLLRQFPEAARRRLGAAAVRRRHGAADPDLAARHAHPRQQDAQDRGAARRAAAQPGEASRRTWCRAPRCSSPAIPNFAPTALLHNLKHNKVLHEHNVILTIITADTPRVLEDERVTITPVSEHFAKVALRFGYMETPNVPKALAIARRQGWHFDIMSTSFFLSRRSLKPAAHSGMPRWQDRLFIGLAKSASDATDFFQIPTGRVVEVGTQVTV